MLMHRQQALQQGLAHRRVLVLLRDQDNRVFLRKNADARGQFLWSVSAAGFQKAHDSLEDTAMTLAESELGESGLHLKLAAAHGPAKATSQARVFLFLSQPARLFINPAPGKNSSPVNGMFADRDELGGMLTAMPELIHPALAWAASACDLFGS